MNDETSNDRHSPGSQRPAADMLSERQQLDSNFRQPIPPVLAIGLNAARQNLTVFFLSVAKTPLKGSHSLKEATKDETELIALFHRYQGACFVGYATGPVNGVAVLDLDFKHPEAVAWYEANKRRLPTTFTYKTRSGGKHLVYQDRPGLKTVAGKIAPGVDVKAKGGYACAWFLHGYEIEDNSPPAPWPIDWLVIPNTQVKISNTAKLQTFKDVKPPPSDILYEREKLWSLLSHVGDDGLRTFDPDCAYNDWCESILMAIGSIGWECAPQIGDAWSKQAKIPDKYPGTEAIYAKMATFKRERAPDAVTERSLYARAIARGWKEPPPSHEAQLELAKRATQDVIETALQDDALSDDTPPQDDTPSPPAARSAYYETDLGNAKRLVARFGADIRFVPERKCWIVWDGTRWRIDSDGEIMRRAKQVTVEMLREAVNIEDSDKRDRQVKHALKCQAAPRLAAMILVASTEAEVVISIEKLDADPMLLGVLNGVIELRTGKFRKAKREDFITMQANVTYDPDATCRNWKRFQIKITAGDRKLIRYKQEALGYCLTGLVTEEKAFIWYGTGDNGKSTERETVFSLMGDYAIAASADLLMEKQSSESATPQVARLKGRRIVAINETREGAILNEARLKYITGHDTISARFLHENPFDFYPSHKPFITTNHKPIVRGTDHGIWKRLHLWPYTVKIPKEEIEREFRERKLMPERSGILNWMLTGLRAYLQRGNLAAPAAVDGATAAYRQDMDVIAQWIEERCSVHPQATITSRAAYSDYEQWARDEIGWVFTKVKFRRNLIDRGFAADKGSQGQRVIQGLRLKEPTRLTVVAGGQPPPLHNR
jgi:putative DNA primase/helicase